MEINLTTDSWYRHPNHDSSRGLIDLMRHIIQQDRAPETIVELGSADGGSAIYWATICPQARVICVDPWAEGGSYGADVYAAFLERTRPYPNIEHVCATAENAAHQYLFGVIDFLYIDAVHEYAPMMEYFRLYRDLMRPDGWIGGHDCSETAFPGVVQAVGEYCKGMYFTLCDTSFLFRLRADD